MTTSDCEQDARASRPGHCTHSHTPVIRRRRLRTLIALVRCIAPCHTSLPQPPSRPRAEPPSTGTQALPRSSPRPSFPPLVCTPHHVPGSTRSSSPSSALRTPRQGRRSRWRSARACRHCPPRTRAPPVGAEATRAAGPASRLFGVAATATLGCLLLRPSGRSCARDACLRAAGTLLVWRALCANSLCIVTLQPLGGCGRPFSGEEGDGTPPALAWPLCDD